MEPTVWIYFSKTGTGYELKGSDVISGFDAFINTDGTYMVEYAFSDIRVLCTSLYTSGTIHRRSAEQSLKDTKEKMS